jgi:tRNA-specific 2-thiouridylase
MNHQNSTPILNWKDALRGRSRVVVGMSGGVDSAVSAWRLKEAGLDVLGLFMKNWEDDDDSDYCSTRQDFLDAAAAAEVIGIELQAVNFAAAYKIGYSQSFFVSISQGERLTLMYSATLRSKLKHF